MGEDILKVMKEIKDKGMVIGSMNATFVALVPKSSHLIYFNDFHLFTLCNEIYKLNAEIIRNWIKKNLINMNFKDTIWILTRLSNPKCSGDSPGGFTLNENKKSSRISAKDGC